MISGSLIYNINSLKKKNDELVRNVGKSFFREIVTTRKWNAMHGGVYVKVNEKTQPNEYLDIPNRDVYTTDSVFLTKVNPAFMTRQISELALKDNEVLYHITSLKPIRPANKADKWEEKALLSFEDDNSELFEISTLGDSEFYRYMAPLMVEKPCLKCHAKQGYKLGDIRGGISVSIRSEPYKEKVATQIVEVAIIHFIILLLGLIGLFYTKSIIRKQFLTIREINEEILKVQQHKEKLNAIIAHDLRAPLAGFMDLCRILEMEYEYLTNEDVLEISQSLYKGASSLNNLLDNLLLWANLQKGDLNYYPEKLELTTIMDEVILLFDTMAREKLIEIKNNLRETEIIADYNMFFTILRNLLSNALKYTPKGGTVYINSKLSGNRIIIGITDTGMGVEKKEIKNLFKEEVHFTKPGTEEEKGSGLGLVLCKELIEMHGGKIDFDSTPGKGTTVTIDIALAN